MNGLADTLLANVVVATAWAAVLGIIGRSSGSSRRWSLTSTDPGVSPASPVPCCLRSGPPAR